jgi:hypothetical protein
MGQQQLMRMEYLQAERTFAAAEKLALASQDFDILSRLYMPLQEARRQRRQRCGEGAIRLDLLATGPNDQPSAKSTIEQFPQGQLILAGWATIQPAIELRRLQSQQGLYVETFLAAVFPSINENVIAIVPFETAQLPKPACVSIPDLLAQLPPHSIVLRPGEIPAPTYNNVMSIWERLHKPFLAAADAESDPMKKIEAYRQTILVDYACELAHQNLSDTARNLCRSVGKRDSQTI